MCIRDRFAVELQLSDRQRLLAALIDGQSLLPERSRCQPVHGSPHRYNIVMVDNAPKFIDFETVAWGPIEWDLAHLEPAVADRYPAEVDTGLLASLRVAISAVTSAHCWHSVHRGPDMRSHAEHHLNIVRSHSQQQGTYCW